jgi:hypothetical protein
LGRCVSADAAADFAALLDLGSRKTFAAAEAALIEQPAVWKFR